MLPAGYAGGDASYPVIYALDGGALYPLLAGYYRYLVFSEEVPESIIVGIAYPGATFDQGNYRSTDYTAPSEESEHWGGAGAFQAFLRDELLPRIESQYRADPARRIIFGHSLGGQFAIYTAMTDPTLFWGHIASNPAMHRNAGFFLQRAATAAATGAQRSHLFVASGTLDVPMFREPAVNWMEHWRGRADLPWTLKTVDLDGHSHMSAAPAAFRDGMAWLFE